MVLNTRNAVAWASGVVDRSGVPEFLVQVIGKPLRRQLRVRTLLIGILLTSLARQELLLTEVHRTLCDLPRPFKRSLGVIGTTGHGKANHELTYRQVEDTVRLVMEVLDGHPVPAFHGVCGSRRLAAFLARQPTPAERDRRDRDLRYVSDRLLEASIPRWLRRAASHALDWTHAPTWSKGQAGARSADPTARWGRRRSNQPGQRDEKFFGFHEQTLVIAPDEQGGPNIELVRRIELYAADVHPAQPSLAFLERALGDGVIPGDLLADSGYSYAVGWTEAVWSLGFLPIVDLHPNDRVARGTFAGALVIGDGLYCPDMPPGLQSTAYPVSATVEN